VHLSDWRALRRANGSCKDLAERLFGFVLAPETLHSSVRCNSADLDAQLDTAVESVAMALARVPYTKVTSLVIGKHKFETLHLPGDK
jgi:hypothetical protein